MWIVTDAGSCTVSHIMVMSLCSKWAAGWGIVSAGRRVGVSASAEVRVIFDTATMIRGLDGVDDALQTPTHRYADTFPCRPIFKATLRAAASWLFFRVARSTRMTQKWALYRQSGSDRLEKQPTDLRRHHHYM